MSQIVELITSRIINLLPFLLLFLYVLCLGAFLYIMKLVIKFISNYIKKFNY
jgi:hypothetical protein